MPKAPAKRPRKPRRKKAPPKTVGLTAVDLAIVESLETPALKELESTVAADGGAVLARYREPYGGRPMLLAALPIDRVAATPFQRDLSEPHVGRLTVAISKIGAYLDPIIAVRASVADPDAPDVRYHTPNGHHRLAALRMLGAKSIVALLVPEADIAYKILALNTEKAHNLKERSLEVIRMAEALAKLGAGTEASHGFEFEDPSLVVLGLAYQERPRFSGGAYSSVVRRTLTEFLDESLGKALETRRAQAKALLAVDDAVTAAIDALKAKGLTSPYLRAFVVARVNPLRFKRGTTADFDETLEKMLASAKKFDASKVSKDDIAKAPPIATDGE